MRLLMIHADHFEFAVTQDTSVSGFSADLSDADRHADLDELLVAFVSAEKIDELGPDDVAAQAAGLIEKTAAQVGAERVMVYPYAHLSSELASPRAASKQIDDVVSRLRGGDLELHRAPFGFYKSFEIACKGHPLSELARTIVPSDLNGHGHGHEHGIPESKAIAAEKTLKSEWRVYLPDGTFVDADKFDFDTDPGLRQLFAYEREGTRIAEDAPPHIKLMREHELVDYEPASDTGNMRWYPKGLLMKRLLEQHVTGLVDDLGAMEVETPIMYDYAHPALSKYLDRFPARQYVVKSDVKEYFLRFAACFGQYMIGHDMVTSYRDLPVRLYELTHFSFRREQGGEVAGLRRLRAFTMPDMHTLVRDTPGAKEEMLIQVKVCMQWLEDLGLECVPAIRFVRSFLDENPEFISELMAVIDRPALIEVWGERFFYFVTKFEMNFIDSSGKAACLSTVQIDVENTERFDIRYTAEDGTRQHPLLMHASISGSLDRNMFAILETQALRIQAGEKGRWPVWLAPTQVRLLPVSDTYIERALELADHLPCRVDVDDRDLKLGKKVREAEKEWVPYTIVVGERELSDDAVLSIRVRDGEQLDLSLDAFQAHLAGDLAGKPLRRANGPRQLSRRPTFVG